MQGDREEAFVWVGVLITGQHDLIDKAVGSILRETGKRDVPCHVTKAGWSRAVGKCHG